MTDTIHYAKQTGFRHGLAESSLGRVGIAHLCHHPMPIDLAGHARPTRID